MSDLMTSDAVPSVDYPGQARWDTLVTSAVLGVDRQAPAAYLTGHPLADWVARWADQPLAVQLLREAFVLDRGLLAGQRPLAVEVSTTETAAGGEGNAPATPVPATLNPAMLTLWRRWRAMEDTEACQQWIDQAAPHGITIPDEDIPWAWALGERNVALRAPLAAVTGPMGAWLLKNPLNPWPYMVRYVQQRSPDEVLNDPASEADERTGAFGAWAPRDPEAAMAWLQGAWDGEKAEFRVFALRALRPHRAAGLDETWWTKRLTDRSRNVRTIALDALWADPSTALSQQENAITRGCFVRRPAGKLGQLFGGQGSMDLVLPAEGTAADDKRGLDIDPGHRKVGRQAWMLHERVRRTHPDLFAVWDGMDWPQRLDWASQTSEARLLLEAWVDATITFGNLALARALLNHPKAREHAHAGVAAVLPEAERQALAKTLLMASLAHDKDADRQVRSWPGIWTEDLTRALGAATEWSFDRNGHPSPWGMAATLMTIGHPRAARALLDELKAHPMAHPVNASGDAPRVELERYWGDALDRRLTLYNALHEIGQAVTKKP